MALISRGTMHACFHTPEPHVFDLSVGGGKTGGPQIAAPCEVLSTGDVAADTRPAAARGGFVLHNCERDFLLAGKKT